MLYSNVRLRIDHPQMQAIVGRISQEAIMRAAQQTRSRYSANIVQAGRVRTGDMHQKVEAREILGGRWDSPKAAVGTPVKYAKYQEYGTRAHGPVRAKALRFKPKGSSTFVFAKWVRGVTPAKFARRALDSIRPTDFLP